MPIDPSLIAGAVPSVIKGIAGLFGIGQGKARARRNIRPVEQVNPLIAQNNAMAEMEALTGLPQEQYNRARQNIARNQTGAYRSLGRSANPTGLASLVRAGNDAVLNLDSQDANARMQNRIFAYGTRGALAGEQNRVWDWNKRQKYMEEAQAASQQINAGTQNAFGGLTDLSMLAQSYLNSENGSGSGGGDSMANTGYNRYKSWSRRGV